MKIRFGSTFFKGRSAQPSRSVTYVLLGLIVFGFSFGTAHRHDGLSVTTSRAVIASESTNGPSFVDVNRSSDNPVRPGECQICQFRQSLSNGAIFSAVLIQSLSASPALSSVLAISQSSNPQTTCRGRAPPAIS